MAEERWIAAKTIALQYALSKEMGVPEAAFADLGLSERDLADPEHRVVESAVYRHLERVAEHVDIASFVVELARRHKMTTMGLPGFGMKTARTARGALETLVRYQHLTNALAAFDLVSVDGRGASWIEHRFAPSTLGAMLATEVSMLVAVNVAREMMPGFVPTRVDIRRSIDAPPPYEAFAGCPIATDAARGAMHFDASLLERPMPTADADMRAYFERQLEQVAAVHDRTPPVLLDLRRVLSAALLTGTPSIDGAARALGVSRRTLQRRLSEEDTIFAAQLDDLRADLARGYLNHPSYTISEVAFMLGYAELSSFYRAFKRWTNETPDAYRSA